MPRQVRRKIQPETPIVTDGGDVALVWVANKANGLKVGNETYPTGAAIDDGVLFSWRNHAVLIRNREVVQKPVHLVADVKPVAIDPTPASTSKPVDVGHEEPLCADHIIRRNRWVKRIAESNGISLRRAGEALSYSTIAGNLWREAARLESERFAQKHRMWNRRPFVEPDFSVGV